MRSSITSPAISDWSFSPLAGSLLPLTGLSPKFIGCGPLGASYTDISHPLDITMTCFMIKVQNLNGNNAKNTSNMINTHQGTNICCTLIHLTLHAN